MIRRNRGMKFLGGYYAFPGGKVDPADGAPESVARCWGLTEEVAGDVFAATAGAPPLAFWMTAVRELLEESGVLLACDRAGPRRGCDRARRSGGGRALPRGADGRGRRRSRNCWPARAGTPTCVRSPTSRTS